MKERPILFSAPMVRAILDGTKTQTRRVVKAKHLPWLENSVLNFLDGKWNQRPLPYGQTGDRLWVRETCRAEELSDGLDGVRYLADDGFVSIQPNEDGINRWLEMRDYGNRPNTVARVKTVPAIHMPRWASRITLDITGVRVERLQACNEVDAISEGAPWAACGAPQEGSHKVGFAQLWESINGPGSWEANPWVWVVEFKRVEGGAA
jgi:hypothetical protein